MTNENHNAALLAVVEKLGEQTATLAALGREVRFSAEQTAAQLREHAKRIDDLERDRDERTGAAQQAAEDARKAIQRVDTRVKLVGALLGLYSAAQAAGLI